MTVLSSTANSPPGKAPCNQEAPGSIALLHICAARDDTSVPTVSARAPPAGQVAMHPTPDAIRHEQPFHRNSQEGGSQRQPLFPGMLSAPAAAVSRVLSCQVAVSMVSDRGRDEPAGEYSRSSPCLAMTSLLDVRSPQQRDTWAMSWTSWSQRATSSSDRRGPLSEIGLRSGGLVSSMTLSWPNRDRSRQRMYG
jgi:hypothetical protein